MVILKKQTKQKKTVSFGKKVEKLELLCIAGRNMKWWRHRGKGYSAFLKKLNTELA